MAKKKQVATYVSENQGESHERPALKRLIAEAAKKSREFDTVKIDNISVLGTPDEAQNAIARFRELGIEVIAMVGGDRALRLGGTPKQDHEMARGAPMPRPEQARERRPEGVLSPAQNGRRRRMVIAPMAVVEIFKTRHPIPWETRRDLRWPSEDNLYIEFANAIVMDPLEDGDLDKVMHGIIVARGENPGRS